MRVIRGRQNFHREGHMKSPLSPNPDFDTVLSPFRVLGDFSDTFLRGERGEREREREREREKREEERGRGGERKERGKRGRERDTPGWKGPGKTFLRLFGDFGPRGPRDSCVWGL